MEKQREYSNCFILLLWVCIKITYDLYKKCKFYLFGSQAFVGMHSRLRRQSKDRHEVTIFVGN